MITDPDRSNQQEQMKPEPQEIDKNLSEDLKTFEELPDKTQELLMLGEKSEKASGKAQARVDDTIHSHS